MKTLVIRVLYLAFVASWGSIPNTAVAEAKNQYAGFSPDSLQAYYVYLNGLEMIEIKASAKFRQAVEAVPIKPSVPITSKQEDDLYNWLYDFLVAFSVSGNDSLVAAFYLREGFEEFNNPGMIEMMKKGLASKEAMEDDTPFDTFRALHRAILDSKDLDYFFGNVSFFDSAFKVFEMREMYDSYNSYLKLYGMAPMGILGFGYPKLHGEVGKRLQAGEKLIFADVMFIIEEPEEFASFEGAQRIPSFFRLVWNPEPAMWCLVEPLFGASERPNSFNFLFFAM